MDVDATRRRNNTAALCYCCGKTGHMRKDCPKRFDIRFLTLDERSELAEQTFAELDANAALATEEQEEPGCAAKEEEEDFVSRSG